MLTVRYSPNSWSYVVGMWLGLGAPNCVVRQLEAWQTQFSSPMRTAWSHTRPRIGFQKLISCKMVSNSWKKLLSLSPSCACNVQASWKNFLLLQITRATLCNKPYHSCWRFNAELVSSIVECLYSNTCIRLSDTKQTPNAKWYLSRPDKYQSWAWLASNPRVTLEWIAR